MSNSVPTPQPIDGKGSPSSCSSSSSYKTGLGSHTPRSDESDDASDFLHVPQHEGPHAAAFKAMAMAAIQARAFSKIAAKGGCSSKADKGKMSQCFASLANARLPLTWPPATDQPDCRLLVTPLLKAGSTVDSDLLAGFTATSGSQKDAKGKAAKGKKREEALPEAELLSGGGPMPRTSERIMTFSKPSPEELEEAKKHPFFPGDYDYSSTEDEVEDYDEDLRQRMARGRRRCLQRQLFSKIDSSPYPPSWSDLEVEVDLMEIMYFLEDCDIIDAKAKREGKAFHEVLPTPSWVVDHFEKFEAMIHRYEGTPSDGLNDRFKAWLLATEGRKMVMERIPPELVSEVTGGRYYMEKCENGNEGGEGARAGGSGGGAQSSTKNNKGKHGKKGKKQGKRK